MIKVLRFFHLLSLDVVFGAIIGAMVFWKILNPDKPLDWVSTILLGVSVWIIYILDRLLDLKNNPENKSLRHQFHAQYQFNLSTLLIALSAIGLLLCFFVNVAVLQFGLMMIVFLMGYFFILHKWLKKEYIQWAKEPITAIVYTAGVAGFSFLQASSINLSAYLLLFVFFLIVSQNLLLFSYFENLNNPNGVNAASFYGPSTSLRLIRFSGMLVLLLGIFFFAGNFHFTNLLAFCFMLMSQILSLMPAFKKQLTVADRYRIIGDAVFFIPVVLLLF